MFQVMTRPRMAFLGAVAGASLCLPWSFASDLVAGPRMVEISAGRFQMGSSNSGFRLAQD